MGIIVLVFAEKYFSFDAVFLLKIWMVPSACIIPKIFKYLRPLVQNKYCSGIWLPSSLVPSTRLKYRCWIAALPWLVPNPCIISHPPLLALSYIALSHTRPFLHYLKLHYLTPASSYIILYCIITSSSSKHTTKVYTLYAIYAICVISPPPLLITGISPQPPAGRSSISTQCQNRFLFKNILNNILYRVIFFNWACPNFAKFMLVSNWFKKNVRVPDLPPYDLETFSGGGS